MMKKYILTGVVVLIMWSLLPSCKKYLDVIPDNIATIDNAFTSRTQAEKYLFTCYSYMPKDAEAEVNSSPALVAGDEMWRGKNIDGSLLGGAMFNIALGLQNVVSPYGNPYFYDLYKGLRDCNIFLENINKVPDLKESEKSRWISEVKFLKAYYHFYLVRMYGPIPLIKENLPISIDEETARVSRDPVDDCFNYIVQLLDEAKDELPITITDASMLGRITKPAALAFKAKVLLTAASPLFNGNTDQSSLKNKDGKALFNSTFSKEKWGLAADACKEAIDFCAVAGIKLYRYTDRGQFSLTDTIKTELSIRNSLSEKWNGEVIWVNTQSQAAYIQLLATAPDLDPEFPGNGRAKGELSPPLKIAEMFYTEHGVPINEDNQWNYNGRYNLRTAVDKDKLYIRKGYVTAELNYNREPRFYASLGFDGGVWYGQGKFDDKKPLDLFYVKGKYKQTQGKSDPRFGSVTGYYPKKLVNYENVAGATQQYTVNFYPWPLIRLADLYLMYAEALNEFDGPVDDVHYYIDLVRDRAGLKSVKYSWDTYTNNKKYTSQNGMRDILRQERLIELAFEGHRFWDLRRWKESSKVLNNPIKGWDLVQETPASYYRPTVVFNQTFGMKDYFWPFAEIYITVNPNLVQNIGWY